ncbi:MAG TPA: Rrf2 family transcriptional regulator [Balneolales bacterium]|nr:Rrf2 family transcriptional regulator [Balneolales bacterium]
MQLLSQRTQYAISAIIVLAREPQGKAIPASELAKPLNCPAAYLSQSLAKLVPNGILDTKRGQYGGVYLLREPSEITIFEVVEALDGTEFFESCFLGIAKCGDIEPCPFHAIWKNEKEKIQKWMEETTFEDIKDSMTDAWFNLRLKFEGKYS